MEQRGAAVMLGAIRRRSRALVTQLGSTLSLWRRSLALVFAAAPRPVAAMAVLMLGQAFLPIGTLWASRAVVNAAARTFGLAAPATGSAGLPLSAWIAVAVAFIVLQQLLTSLFHAAQQAAGDLVTTHIGGALILAANRWRGLARFEDPAFANHLEIARGQAAGNAVDLVSYGGRFVQELFTAVAMGAALWRLHPLAPLLLLLAHIPQAVQENTFGQTMADAMVWQSQDERMLNSYAGAVLDAEPAKDVRLFDLAGFFLGRHRTLYDRASGDVRTLRRRLILRVIPAQVLSGGASALAYLYLIDRVLNGAASLGDLVFFGGALLQLEGALFGLGFDLGFFAMIFTWLPSLFLVLDAGPDLPHHQPLSSKLERGERTTPSYRAPLPAAWRGTGGGAPAPRPVRRGLALEHVCFRYPGAASDVLQDISFTVRPSERLALVGRNGAGKTTLVKLLARLYDPTEGRILLDGVDLREYDLDDLRRQIGVVFQDFVSFQLTAQENIGLGDVARLEDLATVESAADKGGATAVIDGLPQGYATRLGNSFGGVNLSGGQWQKIALSRAFMRQAQLLILDEPTAALDVQAEYDVYRRFAELTQGAMTVLVSHRFSTVRMAGHIIYLEAGRLVEEGSHEALLRHNGSYARLYRLQAELYRDGRDEE
jgi:ATP-binding cassette subfamily B protein